MNIQFASFQQFLLMDGHGPYVWLAVIVSVAVLIGLVVSPLKQQKKIINQNQTLLTVLNLYHHKF